MDVTEELKKITQIQRPPKNNNNTISQASEKERGRKPALLESGLMFMRAP